MTHNAVHRKCLCIEIERIHETIPVGIIIIRYVKFHGWNRVQNSSGALHPHRFRLCVGAKGANAVCVRVCVPFQTNKQMKEWMNDLTKTILRLNVSSLHLDAIWWLFCGDFNFPLFLLFICCCVHFPSRSLRLNQRSDYKLTWKMCELNRLFRHIFRALHLAVV